MGGWLYREGTEGPWHELDLPEITFAEFFYEGEPNPPAKVSVTQLRSPEGHVLSFTHSIHFVRESEGTPGAA